MKIDYHFPKRESELEEKMEIIRVDLLQEGVEFGWTSDGNYTIRMIGEETTKNPLKKRPEDW